MIAIEINDRDNRATTIAPRIRQGIEFILSDAGIQQAEVSVAVVNDATIWQLNRQYLQHDYPTDVLSFLLARDDARLEGEIIVSVDTAAREAVEHGWSADNELLLYVVHGTLHLIGLNDSSDDERQYMRERERHVLAQLGIETPESHTPIVSGATPS